MAIVVVGGSGKDVGKTALMCALLAALREFAWTAVKITGHDYEPAGAALSAAIDRTVWEEMTPGEETDTGRYLVAGAQRALLVTRRGRDVPIEDIRIALGDDRNVIFESNRIVDQLRPDVCLALIGSRAEMKPSFERLLSVADAVVSVGAVGAPLSFLPTGIPRFSVQSAETLSLELKDWLHARLDRAASE